MKKSNPERSSRGGDVDGEEAIDVTMGEAVKVASASYDPGYPFGESADGVSKADIKRGYSSYGKSVGER